MLFLETSAKSGIGVDKAFQIFLQGVHEYHSTKVPKLSAVKSPSVAVSLNAVGNSQRVPVGETKPPQEGETFTCCGNN